MSENPNIAKWKEEAAKVGEPKRLPVPLQVLLGESVEVAKFVPDYREPTDARPGLKSAGPKLRATIGEEILSLRDAVQDAETAYLLIVDPNQGASKLKTRGTELLGEITAALEWYLDNGVETNEDVQLAALNASHASENQTSSTLAHCMTTPPWPSPCPPSSTVSAIFKAADID